MKFWCLLGFVLILQNFSFVLNSRARNSSSLKYHALTNVLSNGTFFISSGAVTMRFFEIMKHGTLAQAVPLGAFYVACNFIGGLGSHWLAMHKFEKKLNSRGV